MDFFDSRVPNNITNYRPIEDDFNPLWFIDEEVDPYKCVYGCEAGGYRITGLNYFWLNCYKLQSYRDGLISPEFRNNHYELFHYLEACEILGKNAAVGKSRAQGISEIIVCQALHAKINEETVIITSPYMQYLAHLKRKEKLNVFEPKITFSTPDILKLGDVKVDKLIFDECGADKQILETVKIGEAKTRIFIGDSVENNGFEKIVLNPENFNVLPHKHNYTKNGLNIKSAFIMPCINQEMVLNKRKKIKDGGDKEHLSMYKQEYFLTIEEALNINNENGQ